MKNKYGWGKLALESYNAAEKAFNESNDPVIKKKAVRRMQFIIFEEQARIAKLDRHGW